MRIHSPILPQAPVMLGMKQSKTPYPDPWEDLKIKVLGDLFFGSLWGSG